MGDWTHIYICTNCGKREEVVSAENQPRRRPCACGALADMRKAVLIIEKSKFETRLRKRNLWPMKSDAAGVHPSQTKEAYEHSRSIGIPTEFTKDGRAIFRDRAHRKKYCEAIGLFDRSGGFGDPQRK